MDKLESYRTIIQQLLEEYTQFGSGTETVEIQLLADTVRDHYQLITSGSRNGRRSNWSNSKFKTQNSKLKTQNSKLYQAQLEICSFL